MLIHSGFITENSEIKQRAQQYNTHGSQILMDLHKQNLGLDGSLGPKYFLTNVGFHYVLLDTPTQVHMILRKYIEYVQSTCPEITVDLIKLIFNLALSEFNQAYKLRSNNSEIQRIISLDFEQLGLVEFTIGDPEKFYITKFMQSFLLT